MSPLQDARAQLVRQQAEKLDLDGQLKATPQGTDAYGQLASKLRTLGTDIEGTRARIRSLQGGGQSSLL